MSETYILKNQNDAYLDKNNEWITSGERRQLFRTPHKDEALNVKVEWAVKHPELRIVVTQVALDEKGLPALDLPRSEKPKESTADSKEEIEAQPIDQLPLESGVEWSAGKNEELGEVLTVDNHIFSVNHPSPEIEQRKQISETEQSVEKEEDKFILRQELSDV